MLRIIPSANAAAAAAYFSESLKREDYYLAGQETVSHWHGKAAAMLGLSGEVESEQFLDLVHNRHWMTGEKLTPGRNPDRIPGWDFNFHAPKSLSLVQGLTGDEELLRVFNRSVAETMDDIEAMISTRVRLEGKFEDRVTGNFAWAEFTHFTARPVGGAPDPHLHTHAYVLNATWDGVEERWKAAKIHDIKSDAPFFQALFHSRLAKGLADLGHSIRRTRTAWELVGVDTPLLEKFSQRTAQIEKEAAKRGITSAKEKDQLGAKTRNSKRRDLTHAELLAHWNSRMGDEERAAIASAHTEKPEPTKSLKVSVEEALNFAEKKLFERNSVVRRRQLITEALRHGVGYVTLPEIEKEIEWRNYVERNVAGEDMLTKVSLVVEEAELIQNVRNGYGKMPPIHPGQVRYQRKFLSSEQREAVRHVLKSSDRISAIRGRAGAGKTTLLQEVRDQVKKQGMQLFAFAPSASASLGVLRDEGFKGADTIARLLVDKDLQLKIRGQVILIDEAGLLGVRDLVRILEIAGDSTRVILSGDTNQHTPVSRGDALRVLETYAGLEAAVVRQIRRQEEKAYREVIEALAESDLRTAFAKLDEINAVLEIPDAAARYSKLAGDYLRFTAEHKVAPLVVSPTHSEGREVTKAIRVLLAADGKLGLERSFLQYRSLRWEEAEKERSENYQPGMMVQFHQNARGIKRGSILNVVEVDAAQTVWVSNSEGNKTSLDLKSAKKFQVFEVGQIDVAVGDLLKITHGGRSANRRRLDNGTVLPVKKIGRDGLITFSNGVTLSPDFGHITHGYCHTSHVSQGKTARVVLVAQSLTSFLAASREGFYVSLSRGKERLQIYTDDRISLQKAAGNSSQHLSALEFSGIGEELFMNGVTGSEWVKRVSEDRQRRLGMSGQVQALLAERKLDPKQLQAESFKQYVETRRSNRVNDAKGLGRSLGSSLDPKWESLKGVKAPAKDDPKEAPEPTSKPAAEPRPKAEPKKQAPSPKTEVQNASKLKRVGKAVEATNKHLSEVVGRCRTGVRTIKEGAARAIQFGQLKTTLGKLNGRGAQKANIEREANRKPAEAVKPKPPSPPVMRRR